MFYFIAVNRLHESRGWSIIIRGENSTGKEVFPWKPIKFPPAQMCPKRTNGRFRICLRPTMTWRAALAKAKEFIPRITAFRGRLAESGAALLSFFRLDDEISLAFDALVHYAQRRSDEDTRVAAYQEMVSQVTRFAVEIQSAAAFETPELLAISDEDMNRLYAEAPELENCTA